MSGTKSTAPETLEELRAALRRWVDGTRSYADHVERDAGAYQDAVWRIAIHRDAANQIAALLPEPIKVGDRVRAEHDPSFEGDVLGGPWDDNGDPTVCVGWDNAMGLELMVVTDLSRVDSSPSPEPERKVEDVIAAASAAGVIGAGLHPAPSPSPEVGEGWRHPVDRDEVAAARRAGVLQYDYPPESSQPTGWGPIWWHVDQLPATRKLRVPSGWAEGREQETETAEPHESEDPEELAAAVAAGLTVNPRPPGADWRDRQTYDGTVSAFREALDYGFRYRIHGTVPGYGETGGAS